MPSASYVDYARLLLAMPGTSEEIGEKAGMTKACAARILVSLWRLGLCHPGGVKVLKVHANRTAVWSVGEGEKAEGLRVKMAARSKAQHIAFAHLWKMLDHGATAHEAAEESGVAHASAYRMIAELKEHGLVRIAAWEPDNLGRPVAVWQIGEGASAKKPKAKRAGQKAKEYRARLVYKALTAIGREAAA